MRVYSEKLNFQPKSKRARKRKGGSECKIFHLYLLYVRYATKYENLCKTRFNFYQSFFIFL